MSKLESTFVSISIQPQDFDITKEYAHIRKTAVNPGAIALFTGLVRDILSDVPSDQQSLTLEHYPGMTEAALQEIANQASQRWPLQSCRIIHRVGTLLPGDQIVLVACASAHRSAAFDAIQFIMDYLKTSAPFWKKQLAGDSSHWIESRESDYRARERWDMGLEDNIPDKG
jgi:molybdopterin synthase catalytic subunit